jgi:hypothetical protein
MGVVQVPRKVLIKIKGISEKKADAILEAVNKVTNANDFNDSGFTYCALHSTARHMDYSQGATGNLAASSRDCFLLPRQAIKAENVNLKCRSLVAHQY